MPQSLRKICRTVCVLCASAMLAACGSSQGVQTEVALQAPNLAMPVSGITQVKDVMVTPRENDTLELTAAANATFKFEQVQAVLWCRASRYAKENNFADWAPLKVEQLRAATDATPMVARGTVQLVKTGPVLPGRAKPPVKDWCKDVPRVAVS